MTEKNDVFPARLREAMRKKRVTRKKIADACNVHISTVGRWLRQNNERPSGWNLLIIAQHLECSVNWLVGLRDTPERPQWLTPRQEAFLAAFGELDETGQDVALAMLQEAAMALKAAKKQERCD